MTKERALYDAINYAKRYALDGRSHVAKIWLKRALKLGPLSPLQQFNLKRIFDERLLREVGLISSKGSCHGSEQLLTGLAKRLGRP